MPSEPNRTEGASLPASPPRRPARLLPALGLALLAVAGVIGGYFLLRTAPGNGHAQPHGDDPPKNDARQQFAGWGKPDLVLVVSGQMHGYIGPCGCSSPQMGGLIRRSVFIESLKAKGWEVAGVDLGELAQTKGIHEQNRLKLEFTLRALRAMDYAAFGLGKQEFLMPLTDAMAVYSVNNPIPRPLAASLDLYERDDKGNVKKDMKGEPVLNVYHALNVRPHAVFGKGVKVGVTNLVGPDLGDELMKNKGLDLRFLDNGRVVPQVLKALAAEKVDLGMVLYHDYPKPNPLKPRKVLPAALAMDAERLDQAESLAQFWAKTKGAPPLQIVMLLTEIDLPPATMKQIKGTPTQVIEISHKGKYVGVVGIFRDKKGGFDLKYELVEMSPKYDVQDAKNAVLDVMEKYAEQVKKDRLLDKQMRSSHPMQVDPYVVQTYGGAHYVGSNVCGDCHLREDGVWNQTKHATAFTKLKKATKPSLREFDPECVVCHTVGFQHPSGYNQLSPGVLQKLQAQGANADAIKKRLAKHNVEMENVGCENCHGPASAHVKNTKDAKLYPLLNPFRPGDAEKNAVKAGQVQQAKILFDKRMLRLDDFCQKCHDSENDVHWGNAPFLKKWVTGGIVHNRKDNVGNQWLQPFLPGNAPPPNGDGDAKKD